MVKGGRDGGREAVRDRGRDSAGSGDFVVACQSLPALFLDLRVEAWRKKVAHGDVIVVRYADDAVPGFQHEAEAERFLADLRERLRKFGLELNSEKTRLIEFGR